MPAPKRQLIREALRDMLINQTSAGTNVFPDRVSAFWKSELPSISIFFREEEGAPRNISGKDYIRKARIGIEVHCEVNEGLDSRMDEIADKVEETIFADLSLRGTVYGTIYQGSSFEFSGEGTGLIGVISMTFEITYKNEV